MDRKLSCPKCAKPMEEGFALDRDRAAAVSTWVAGQPERNFWFGLDIRDRKRIPIRTYRCPGCGYLESYADEETDVKEKG